MKKIFIILLLTFALASCGNQETAEKKFYKTYTVKEGSVSSRDSILSTLEGTSTSILAFKNPGRIKSIAVREGDKVKAGDVMATLSNEEANISFAGMNDVLDEMSKMGVDVAAISDDTIKMKEAVSSLYDERLRLLDDTYAKSKIATQMAVKDLDLSKSNYEDVSMISIGSLTSSDQKIKQAENAFKMSKNNLDNSKISLETAKSNILKNSINSLTNAYIVARNAREYTDVILSLTNTNKNKNIDYEIYLGAKNLQFKNNAISSFWNFNAKYLETYNLYSQKIVGKDDIPKATVVEALQSANSTLEALRDHLHDFKDMLDNSIPAATLPDETLNNMKIQTSTILSNLEQVILSSNGAGVKGSLEMINSFDSDYSQKIKQLEDALDIAAEDMNLAKTGKDITVKDNSKNLSGLKTNISIKEDSVKLSKISEEEVIKNMNLLKQEKISKLQELDAKLSEINSKLSEIGSKKAEVRLSGNLAVNSIESGIIRAPFDGVVIKVAIDEGAVVGGGTPLITFTSTDKKILKAYIDNTKMNLKIGDEVKLINEKTRQTLTGSVLNVSDTQDLINKKNHIEIKTTNENAKVGDRFLIDISRKQDKQSIIIPVKSLITKYGTPGVYVFKNKKAEFKLVSIIQSDAEYASVTGVSVGDKVITDGKDNILDGEILE